jgi:hypothetical protein
MMDRLEELIKGCEQWDEQWDNGAINELSILLTELKQRRESELRQADKFLGASLNAQMYHVKSEFEECIEAYGNLIVEFDYCPSKQERLIEELVDLQMSCCTMLAILGLDEQQRMEARRKVIEKNRARGYYKVSIAGN